jgi:hypothetical protein
MFAGERRRRKHKHKECGARRCRPEGEEKMRIWIGKRMRWSIVARMLVAPVLMGLLSAASAVMALASLERLQRDLHTVAGDLAPDSGLATRMLETLYQQRLSLQGFLNSREAEDQERFLQLSEQLAAIVSQASADMDDAARQGLLQDFDARQREYQALFTDALVPAVAAVEEIGQSRLDAVGERLEAALVSIGEEASATSFPALAYAAELANRQITLMRMHTQRYLLNPGPEQMQKIRAAMERAGTHLAEVAEMAFWEEFQALYAEIEQDMAPLCGGTGPAGDGVGTPERERRPAVRAGRRTDGPRHRPGAGHVRGAVRGRRAGRNLRRHRKTCHGRPLHRRGGARSAARRDHHPAAGPAAALGPGRSHRADGRDRAGPGRSVAAPASGPER